MKAFAASLLSALLATILHAQTWTVVNMHPPGADSSELKATDGTQQVGDITVSGTTYGGVWAGTPASFTDLTPSGTPNSDVYAVAGGQQAGYGVYTHVHALVWAGTTGSFIDLNPVGMLASELLATNGVQQGGYTFDGTLQHAAIWTGTAASVIDLNPAGAMASQIAGMDSRRQVGTAAFGGSPHAGMWTGSAASFVSLHPAIGTSSSRAVSIAGDQQAGDVYIAGSPHAAIWAGTAESFVDLNPSFAAFSSVAATTGTIQAGYAKIGGNAHAAIWRGSVESFLDLHAFLSADYTISLAEGLWTDGHVVQVVGVAFNAVANREEAVMWQETLPQNSAPTVHANGKKRRVVHGPRIAIRGTAADANGNLLSVAVKVDNTKYKTAKGSAHWKFTVHLKPGRNKILVRAMDASGAVSTPAKLIITRR